MTELRAGRFGLIVIGLCLAGAASCMPMGGLKPGLAAQSGAAIFVAYPHTGSSIDSRTTFITGAAPAGVPVTCNGESVRANSAGFFAHVVKLNRGDNTFTIAAGQHATVISVRRPAAPVPVPPSVFRFKPGSMEPARNIGVSFGDVIRFAVKSCPGASIHVKLGNRTIPLHSVLRRGKGGAVNQGLDTAFGVTWQRGEAMSPDLYLGFYKVSADDLFAGVRPSFVAVKDKKTITTLGPGAVSVMRQPVVYRTRHADTIVRVGPGQSRTTPWVDGVRAVSDGYNGDWRRLEMTAGKHLWVLGEDLDPEPPGSPPPESRVTTVNLQSDEYGASVVLPLNQRLPYQVEQDLKAGTLVLKIFGATADTDFVTSDTEEGQIHPKDRASAKLIDYVTWKQKSDGLYELTVHLRKKHQWGFFVDYQGSNMTLHVKSPPNLDSAGSLRGVIVCVDPGHGGKEPGATGCNGTREAVVNLAIAERLKTELEKHGARVVMTRTADVDASLAQRVQTAIAARADFLISVHNNSLPDGRDPWKEHGTSSYWYHPQSVEAARVFKDGLVKDTGLRDFGSRYQNLFLCRPTNMPAVLVEVGFMINPDEFLQLITPEFQSKVAGSLAEQLRAYIIQSSSN